MTLNRKITARPTVYKGVHMRSRLEAGFAAWLDAHDFDWEYEPYAFADDSGQYLPDFRIADVRASWVSDTTTLYVEVKPDSFVSVDVLDKLDPREPGCPRSLTLLCRYAAIVRASDKAAIFVLAQPQGLSAFVYKPGDETHWPFPLMSAWAGSGGTGFAIPSRAPDPWGCDYWAANTSRGPTSPD